MSLFTSSFTDCLKSLNPRFGNESAGYQDDDLPRGTAFHDRTHSMHERPRLARRADPVEVAATLPVLDSLSQQLRDTASDLQQSVLEISTGFCGIAARARESVQLVRCGLESGDSVSADQTISEIHNVMHGLLAAVKDSSQLSARLSGRIQELEEVLSRVNGSLRQVEKIAEQARIVGLNGRLEAARAGSHGDAFNVVANETINLGVHASETSASIRKLAGQLDTSLLSVSADLQARVLVDAETARTSSDRVTVLLDQLGRLHNGLTDSLHKTESVSQSLTQEIGRSVMALQFQDRVNQRIDHVIEALQALQENLSPYSLATSPERTEARVGDWRRWLESRSTMKSERELIRFSNTAAPEGGNSDFGSVELFQE